MIKKTITYEDLDGNKISEDFYFHLNKAELVELEASVKGGLSESLKALVAAENVGEAISLFKKIILLSYGQRSEDGKRFIKNQELRDAFAQTDAYSELFVELAMNADAGATFVKGILPTGLAQEAEAAIQKPEIEGVKDPTQMTREELLEAFKTKGPLHDK